jgi:hypothetical protein
MRQIVAISASDAALITAVELPQFQTEAPLANGGRRREPRWSSHTSRRCSFSIPNVAASGAVICCGSASGQPQPKQNYSAPRYRRCSLRGDVLQDAARWRSAARPAQRSVGHPKPGRPTRQLASPRCLTEPRARTGVVRSNATSRLKPMQTRSIFVQIPNAPRRVTSGPVEKCFISRHLSLARDLARALIPQGLALLALLAGAETSRGEGSVETP